MATRLLASPRVLNEWKARTRELCDSSGMWWVSWWVKRFSATLRLSGSAPKHPNTILMDAQRTLCFLICLILCQLICISLPRTDRCTLWERRGIFRPSEMPS